MFVVNYLNKDTTYIRMKNLISVDISVSNVISYLRKIYLYTRIFKFPSDYQLTA